MDPSRCYRSLIAGSSFEKLMLTYRTETDRLNMVSPAQFDSQAAGCVLSLLSHWMPSCALGTLTIRYPHPQGRSGFALVTTNFRPAYSEIGTMKRTTWSKIQCKLKGCQAESDKLSPPLEVWTMDFPKWQLDAIVGKLTNSYLFDKRVGTSKPDVFLSVRLDTRSIGKNYKAIPKLDALVMRTCTQGRRVMSRSGMGVRLVATAAFPGTIPADSRPAISRLSAVPVTTRK